MSSLALALALQIASPSATIECSRVNPAACATSIFFDSGEGRTIRTEWLDRLDALAARARNGGHIRIDGYSDRSGPDGVNRAISATRARSVRQALLERGVPAAAIIIIAHGEEDALVGTPDGVREAQNRRVDLTVEP